MILRKVFVLMILFLLVTFSTAEGRKNVIYMIGDGMGIAQMTLAHHAKGSPLTMEAFPNTGIAFTPSLDSFVTDSAAAGTALATGNKTKNGMISMVPGRRSCITIMEAAQNAGWKAGIVTTTRVTHATPACFGAHQDNRGSEEKIAVQMVESRVNVLFGGGRAYFLPEKEKGRRKDGENLFIRAREVGYTIIGNRSEMAKASGNMIMGLFTDEHMSYELDRDPTVEPSLAAMTAKAIEVLSDPKNTFFLMVEGGKIDHAAHNHDAASVVAETLAFDRAVQVALEFAGRRSDTIVVVTADHETGGLSLSNGDYCIKPQVLSGVTRSFEELNRLVNKDRSNIVEVVKEYTGINDLSNQEIDALKAEVTPPKGFMSATYYVLAQLINQRAMLAWPTTSHSGCPVAVLGFGPGTECFNGFMDNTDLPKRIAGIAGIDYFNW
ncbi:MAG: alkaline phosphatase [Candidatus Wallbacteria bacterium]|nr:alkaline phosphatase [Candidatus Wallbacteria bacterium]